MKEWVHSLVEWEKELFLKLNGSSSVHVDSFMYLISDKGPWIVFLVLLLFLLAYKQNAKEYLLFVLFTILLIVLADGLSSGIIKPIFQRERPTNHALTKELVQVVMGNRGGWYGFISGHTTNFIAFATFTSLVFRNKWYTAFAFITALTVAYSRIYLGVHFITDVLPGIVVGLAVGYFVYYLYYQGRIAFLGVRKEEAKQCYLKPYNWSNYLALQMVLFYLLLWAFAPLLIKLYQ